jgi:hypothetical protein
MNVPTLLQSLPISSVGGDAEGFDWSTIVFGYWTPLTVTPYCPKTPGMPGQFSVAPVGVMRAQMGATIQAEPGVGPGASTTIEPVPHQAVGCSGAHGSALQTPVAPFGNMFVPPPRAPDVVVAVMSPATTIVPNQYLPTLKPSCMVPAL